MVEEFKIIERYVPQITKPSYMLVGLPDAGLVGGIVTEYLINNLNMKEYGEIYSPDLLPPISHVANGQVMSPVRLYHSINFIVVHSWIAIPSHSLYPLAKTIINYAKKYGIDTIISITGLPVSDRLELKSLNTFWVSSNEDLAKELEQYPDIKKFDEGYIAGPYAPLLLESKFNGVRNFLLIVESFQDLPDPEASAKALQFISRYIGFNVDVSGLLKEAEEIRDKIKGLMEQTKRQMPQYSLSGRPTTYA